LGLGWIPTLVFLEVNRFGDLCGFPGSSIRKF
jgi:hypothetical protein